MKTHFGIILLGASVLWMHPVFAQNTWDLSRYVDPMAHKDKSFVSQIELTDLTTLADYCDSVAWAISDVVDSRRTRSARIRFDEDEILT